ncbi:MAG: methyltransferase [Pseudomonadota bacterium]
MLSTRLDLLLRSGVATVPKDGRIAVVGARAGTDLSMLPKDRVDIIQRHYPDHQAFATQGYSTQVELSGRYALSIIALPRAKAESRAAIAAARAATDGLLLIDGQKTDGIDSLLKELRKRATVVEVLSKAHGKLCVIEGGIFEDWQIEPGHVEGFMTGPGVFSADRIDPGSAALIEALPNTLGGHVVDLGAGWGVLADAAFARGAASVDLVEADHVALSAARQNITNAAAQFHWADARTFRPETQPKHILCNPPFHTSRAADPALGQAFIKNARAILSRHGTLWLVANRHLPYERVLEEAFASLETVDQTAGYKIIRAERPRPLPKGR